MKTQGIYCIEHVNSGKKYYGSSLNITKRFSQHKNSLIKNKHHCIYLQRAVNKYGIEAFNFYIVEETKEKTKQELFLMEESYIKQGINLYNIGSVGGGDNLSKHPDKENIIRRRTETILNNLSLLTKEEKDKRFVHTKGSSNGNWKNGNSRKMCPICQKVKISAVAKTCMDCQTYDRKGTKNPFYGKKHSDKTLNILRGQTSWAKGINPEDHACTKQYEIIYPSGSTKKVYGLKAIAIEFESSIANVNYTIHRMKRNSMPTKRSRFYLHIIREID